MNKEINYVLEKLKPQGVIKVRPLEKVVDNVLKRTPLLVLYFKTEFLPETIKVGYEIRYVRPYKLRPSQCKKCFRFGHWADSCNKQRFCVTCGAEGVEHGTDCSEPLKCCLCVGSHIATDHSCPKWVRQLKICEILWIGSSRIGSSRVGSSRVGSIKCNRPSGHTLYKCYFFLVSYMLHIFSIGT